MVYTLILDGCHGLRLDLDGCYGQHLDLDSPIFFFFFFFQSKTVFCISDYDFIHVLQYNLSL